MIWTRPKQIGHIQNGWYSTKIIWTVQNQFGPIEGQGISLKNKGHYPHYLEIALIETVLTGAPLCI